MTFPMSRLKTLFLAILLLALGAAGGLMWSQRQAPADLAGAPTSVAPTEKKVLYWYDPMVPQQHFDKPGKSPFMDMELVPKYAEENAEEDAEEGAASGADAGVRIDPAALQNLGVRLATVERIPLSRQIEATGLIGFNEREVTLEQARAGGFVERVWPLAPGDVIGAGQPLAELLVPEWAAAQEEWLALRAFEQPALLAAARNRLRLLGMPEALIREVEASGQPRPRFVIRSSRAGVIQSLDVRAGMTLMPGQTLARVNGLASVWLEVAVPEALAEAARVGGHAEVSLAAQPGRTIAGRVSAVLPALDAASRSLRVRVELPNRGGALRPGMSAQVALRAAGGASALAVPTEAVIRTGKRALVMLAEDGGRFMPVEVTLGREAGDRSEIIAGLEEGQKIVASGQFLIDSEASLSGVIARSAPAAGAEQ